ncbi:amidohydrolase family protein [Cyanobium sp. Cruz CV13-4-11]|uniref:amidohydrolase family protein n=1 Tax=unclassified Cyanobium TaxID=2627006 RepID=UPI0020CC728E|nr:amidohydrolase family protein [Cyanobium sp. Cruz CV11-17]MCP9920410.1 amidohydrolase family protein [Cyanobium sp. Cruz CV13-4-11]
MRFPRALLDPLARLPAADDQGLVAVQLEQADGRIRAIHGLPAGSGGEGLDGGAPLPLALTPLVEPHAHLDKAFSGEAFPNPDGTMAGAMAANGREAAERQAEAVRRRGERALERAWRYGLRAIRSHIDSLGPWAIPSWEVLLELRRHWRSRVELQLVALVPVGHWSTPEGEAFAAWVAARGGLLGGVLGAPFRSTPADRADLLALMRLAERLGCGVDLHVDESAEEHGRGVALVSDLLLRHRMVVPLTCSHASSMALLADRPCRRLAEAMADAAVGVVALPTTNLWLLGKHQRRTPSLRPQAPIRQLQEAGVTVAVGGDNVQDPWFPGGDFDPIALLRFSLAASHLVPWRRLGLSPFSTAAARLLGLDWDGVLREGAPADLLVLGASSWGELLARPPRRRVLRAGHWLEPPPCEEPSPLLAACHG